MRLCLLSVVRSHRALSKQPASICNHPVLFTSMRHLRVCSENMSGFFRILQQREKPTFNKKVKRAFSGTFCRFVPG